MKKNKSVRGLILISLVSLVPMIALAQSSLSASNVTAGIGTFGSIINVFTQSIVRALATLFATAAMAAFFYGIVQYIWGIRDGVEAKIKTGNQFMIWGLISLFVMFSVWGIIIYTQRIFGIEGQNTILIPDVRIQNGSGTAAPASPLGASPNQQVQQNQQAQQAYNLCISNGNSSAQCQSAYQAYGGAGSGTNNLAQQAYDSCISNGNSAAQCQSAYDAYGGTGSPSSGTGKVIGSFCTSNAQCASGYCDPADDSCSNPPDVTNGGLGGGANNGGNSNTPYGYCPDGTAYYSASDAKFCAPSGTGGYACDPQDPTCTPQ